MTPLKPLNAYIEVLLLFSCLLFCPFFPLLSHPSWSFESNSGGAFPILFTVSCDFSLSVFFFLPSSAGQHSRIDIGVISGERGEESHHFINVADIHL